LDAWRLREARRGRGPAEAAQRAVEGLVAWGLSIAGPLGGQGYFVTGGHTLAAFFDRAGLARFGVQGEALPGAPLGVAEGPGGACWLASKPGGFGTRDLYPRFLGL
jgi:uncharacterized protein YgbK (DUF1537 family)